MSKTETHEITVGTEALLKGYGSRIWRVQQICDMEDDTVRYRVSSHEPSNSGVGLGFGNTTHRLVEREDLTIVLPSNEEAPHA